MTNLVSPLLYSSVVQLDTHCGQLTRSFDSVGVRLGSDLPQLLAKSRCDLVAHHVVVQKQLLVHLNV